MIDFTEVSRKTKCKKDYHVKMFPSCFINEVFFRKENELIFNTIWLLEEKTPPTGKNEWLERLQDSSMLNRGTFLGAK